MGKIFIFKGRRYYTNREDALREKCKGDKIYYDAHLRAYYIVRPRKKNLFL